MTTQIEEWGRAICKKCRENPVGESAARIHLANGDEPPDLCTPCFLKMVAGVIKDPNTTNYLQHLAERSEETV